MKRIGGMNEKTLDSKGLEMAKDLMMLWKPISEAAVMIGASERTLRAFVNGEGDRPMLCSKEVKGVRCVQPAMAADHLRQHARCAAGAADAPISGTSVDASTSPGAPTIDPEIVAALGGVDPYTLPGHELAQRLAIAGVSEGRVRALVGAVNAKQRHHEAELRAGKNLAPEDVVRMLRSGAMLFCEQIDECAPRWAAELLRILRQEYGLETAKFSNATARLEDFYREQANSVIIALRKEVNDQIQGVELLKL
jgi:hypothetical protein